MDLNQYFSLPGAKTASAIAREVGVSPSVVYQWRRKLRPIPTEYGAPLEQATDGRVSRKDNWPDDWARIWPELLDSPPTIALDIDSDSPDAWPPGGATSPIACGREGPWPRPSKEGAA